jgi:hypothetical protein
VNIGVSHRDLGNVDVESLRSAYTALTETEWATDSRRQAQFRVHRATQSVVLMWSEHDGYPDLSVEITDCYPRFAEALRPAFSRAAQNLDTPVSVVSAMIARLGPSGAIGPHMDTHRYFAGTHRFHVPLQTNPGVEFLIEGVPVELAEGRLYEINNRWPHSVENRGDEPRDHLIFDLIPAAKR